MVKRISSFFILLLIYFISFASAILTHGTGNVQIDTSTVTNHFNGSNINVSTTSCGGTDKVISINNATGTVTCGADIGGAYNDAWINQTIYNRTFVDINISTSNTSMLNWITNVFNVTRNNYLIQVNTSMKNYCDAQDSSYNTSNNNYINFLNTSNNNYILFNNQSLINYILFVNSTNGIGSGGYVDSWINQTIYNRTFVDINISTSNTSIKNYADNRFLQIINWNATNISYALLTVLNNGSYLNSGGDSFVTNYSTFLTHINYAQAGNGTLAYTSWLNNGSYLNTAETDPKAYNGTLVSMSVLNNGTYANTGGDSFVANYSTFLTHINFTQAMNGTLAWMSNFSNYYTKAESDTINTSNNNYIVFANTSMNNYCDAQDSSYNTSNNNYINFLNTSNNNYINFLNTSNNNYILFNNQSLINYILFVNSTNGAGGSSYVDTWINQTIYNRTFVDINISTSNTSMLNWITNVFNVTRNNYLIQVNTSMKNYCDAQDSSYNTSNNNYITSTNTSIKNYADSQFIKNQTSANLTVINVSYIRFNQVSGNCDLTINGTMCKNATGVWIVG